MQIWFLLHYDRTVFVHGAASVKIHSDLQADRRALEICATLNFWKNSLTPQHKKCSKRPHSTRFVDLCVRKQGAYAHDCVVRFHDGCRDLRMSPHRALSPQSINRRSSADTRDQGPVPPPHQCGVLMMRSILQRRDVLHDGVLMCVHFGTGPLCLLTSTLRVH